MKTIVAPVVFWLPVPISANAIWRKSRGRIHLSSDYVAWIVSALAELNRQGITAADVETLGPPPYKVSVTVQPGPTGNRGWRMSRDLDNLWKALLDLLAKRSRVLPSDNSKTIQALALEIGPEAEKAGVVVTIEPWPRMDRGGNDLGSPKNPRTGYLPGDPGIYAGLDPEGLRPVPGKGRGRPVRREDGQPG